jgi:hypothetical protein
MDGIRQKGGVMSDQADSLRQLVRARREWRELTLEELTTPVSRPRPARASFLDGGEDDEGRPPIGGNRVGVLMVRAARWAFGRTIR